MLFSVTVVVSGVADGVTSERLHVVPLIIIATLPTLQLRLFSTVMSFAPEKPTSMIVEGVPPISDVAYRIEMLSLAPAPVPPSVMVTGEMSVIPVVS